MLEFDHRLESKPNKVRVAFFAEILIEDYDGASRTMYEIIKRIDPDRFEFIFFCGVPPKTDFGFEVVVLPAVSIPFNKKYKMAIPYLHQEKVNAKLEAFNPDLIHIATPSPLGNFASKYALQNDVRMVSIYHTHFISYVDYYCKGNPWLAKLVKKGIQKSIKGFYESCDKVLVPTTEMISDLERLNIDSSNMVIWQRGINKQIFNPNKKRLSLIKAITENDKPNIIFASRLVWEKNLHTLISIYEHSKQNGDKYNFIIAGDGVALNTLRKKMPNAFFLGHVKHDLLSKLYASSDLFLFPSISETFGNVVLEAMASGVPCVIANGGGTKTFIEDGVNGYLCEANNSLEYLSKIDQLLSNTKLRNSFKTNGLEFVQDFDWENIVGQYFLEIEAMVESSYIVAA